MNKVIAVFALLISLAWAGCNRDTTGPTANSTTTPSTDISDQAKMLLLQYGSIDDPSLTTEVMMPRDSLRHLLADTSLDIYSVTLLWGVVRPAAPPMPPFPEINWTGTMSTNAVGLMRLSCPIDFEPNQDTILPTPDPMSLAWKSLTAWDIDGVSALICVKRGVAYLVEPTFEITTKPASLSLPIGRLVKFDSVLIVDPMNAMVIHSRLLPHVTCPAGKIVGKWTRTDSTMTVGTFEGVWMRDSAVVGGALLGHFWRVDNTRGLLEGKYTDSTGEVIGYVKGTWCFQDPRMCIMCGTGMGMFAGPMIDLDGKVVGRIQGRFGPPATMTDPATVPFVGTWQSLCADEKNTDGTVF